MFFASFKRIKQYFYVFKFFYELLLSLQEKL
jgi:hypothetical protein